MGYPRSEVVVYIWLWVGTTYPHMHLREDRVYLLTMRNVLLTVYALCKGVSISGMVHRYTLLYITVYAHI
jgi:hypothetical protein